MLFQTRENTVFLSLGCRKLKGLGELTRILNTPEGEVRGKHTFPNMTTAHGALTAHLMCPLMFCPYI